MFQNTDIVHGFIRCPTFQKLAYFCRYIWVCLVLAILCKSPARAFHSLPTAQDSISVPWIWQSLPQCHCKGIDLQCPPALPAHEPCWVQVPLPWACHSLQGAQLLAGEAGWVLGRKMLRWQTCCGLLCRVCVSYLMCLMTRPNFCESAQELFMANDILAMLYYFVCAFVCACV